MGSGTIDPDPVVYPGAAAHLHHWPEAVNIFLRLVPQTSILLAAISRGKSLLSEYMVLANSISVDTFPT
jgi:hypothetical protein